MSRSGVVYSAFVLLSVILFEKISRSGQVNEFQSIQKQITEKQNSKCMYIRQHDLRVVAASRSESPAGAQIIIYYLFIPISLVV